MSHALRPAAGAGDCAAADAHTPTEPAGRNGRVDATAVEEPPTPAAGEAELLAALAALKAEEPRDHLNIVFIGHIDAGKSTLAGQILLLTGCVDERTIERYERLAKEQKREGWYMAYIMDTGEEERAKGITIEVGRAAFSTPVRRYTILDAPGHPHLVPNMIKGACQADVAILLISARKGEFETGFERGGQTREHAQLAKTLGVGRLIVAVNKLDCPSVAVKGGTWDVARFGQVVDGLTPYLKQCGYNVTKEVSFIPLTALNGHNVKHRAPPGLCDWYTGCTLLEALDGMEVPERSPLVPFRLPIVDKLSDMGTVLVGKSEAGLVQVGDVLQVMPNRLRVRVEAIQCDGLAVRAAMSGESLSLRVSGAQCCDISVGSVLSSIQSPVPVAVQFECQLRVVEVLKHNPIFTKGYRAMLHVHTAAEECEVTAIVAEIDPKTRQEKKARFIRQGGVAVVRIALDKPIALEQFSVLPSLGRFTLRDGGRTIAIGKVTKLPKALSKATAV